MANIQETAASIVDAAQALPLTPIQTLEESTNRIATMVSEAALRSESEQLHTTADTLTAAHIMTSRVGIAMHAATTLLQEYLTAIGVNATIAAHEEQASNPAGMLHNTPADSEYRERFAPYRSEVAGLYTALLEERDPSHIPEYITKGGSSYIFRSSTPGKIIKIPLAERRSIKGLRKEVTAYVSALTLGRDHPRLEQLDSFNNGDLPAVITDEIVGKGLDKIDGIDVTQITDDKLRQALADIQDMHRRGITIEGEIWADVLLEDQGFTFIDYVKQRRPLSEMLIDFGWLLAFTPLDAPREEQGGLAMRFFAICAEELPSEIIAPLKTVLRNEAGLPI